MAEERMISRDRAAHMLGLSIRTVEKLIRGEHLESVKIGARRLIRRSSVLRLRRHGVSAVSRPQTVSRDHRGRFRKTPLTEAVGTYYKTPRDPDLKILLALLREVDPALAKQFRKIKF
jgi:excisionase family DNA binding protein